MINIMKQCISNDLTLRFVYRNINENNGYFWKCLLQHTKPQVKLFEVQ